MRVKRYHTTQKGTKLAIVDVKGQDYMQAHQRIIWFREERPDWGIETSIQVRNGSALATAKIYDPNGALRATAHKFESKDNFKDFIEKAETGAIGRALSFIGYGTQFASDLIEGERIVDSPIEVESNAAPVKPKMEMRQEMAHEKPKNQRPQIPNYAPGAKNPNDFTIDFGKKHKGMLASELDAQRDKKNNCSQLESFYKWCDKQSNKGHQLIHFMKSCDKFWVTEPVRDENKTPLDDVIHPASLIDEVPFDKEPTL